MIFKQRMLNYPQGQDIAAVLYRYEIYDRLSDNPVIDSECIINVLLIVSSIFKKFSSTGKIS